MAASIRPSANSPINLLVTVFADMKVEAGIAACEVADDRRQQIRRHRRDHADA